LEGTGVGQFTVGSSATRATIILWTTLAVMPAKFVFDAIEAELGGRGIDP
jgi:hypothetical protein